MNIVVTFAEDDKSFAPIFGAIQTMTERVDPTIQYEGEYTATPRVREQTLPTEKKFLDKDITIRAIPFFETSNTSNGKTVYIANEV